MKWFMAIGAVLVLPALAFGGASYTLTSGGSSAITIDTKVSSTFTVDIGITHDYTEGVGGFNCALNASVSDVFSQTGRTVHLSDWDANTLDGKLFTGNPLIKTAALAGQDLGGICVAYPSYVWSGSPLATQTVNMSTTASPGVYTLSLGSPGLAGLNVFMGAEGTEADVGAAPTLEVTVIPEPASMLLLVGALPFLRRRRSS